MTRETLTAFPLRARSGPQRTGICACVCALAAAALFAPLPLQAEDSATLQGWIRDEHARPVPSAAVSLSSSLSSDFPGQTLIAHADAAGSYRFAELRAGTYRLRAEMPGYGTASFGPFVLAAKESKQVDLTLPSAGAPAGTAEFFEEPNFIVAGVADANNRGGHGSAAVARSTEALAKAAATLSAASSKGPVPEPEGSPASANEKTLREALDREPADARLHHALGNLEEARGNALEAAREYQRAAELDTSETNLFDWGTELLTHRAAEPSTEVFAKGNRLFPRSARMLLGLGAALYARGSYDEAARRFFAAVDLNPDDPGPYLFLGKVASAGITPLDGSVQRLSQFARLQPGNPLANYYYAAVLWKRWNGPQDRQTTAHVQSLLAKAVRLDPSLADAHLLLGILYFSLLDFRKAIGCYQKAIAADAQLAEAHYRLAQAYQRTGEKLKARAEFDRYEQLVKTSAAQEERQRSEVQQFVFAMRDR
jgi:tetratricopeptide (TPR) repeat protein